MLPGRLPTSPPKTEYLSRQRPPTNTTSLTLASPVASTTTTTYIRPSVKTKWSSANNFRDLLATLYNCPGVRTVDLSAIGLDDNLLLGLLPALAVCKHLEKLDVSLNHLTHKSLVPLLRTVASLPMISSLDLTATSLSDMVGDELALTLARMPNLRELSLSSTGTPSRAFSHPHFILPPLTQMDLSGCDLSGRAGVSLITQIARSGAGLVSLSLSRSGLDVSLSPLAKCSCLSSLDLASTPIDAPSLCATLPLLACLRQLDLSCCALRGEATSVVLAIAASPSSTEFRALGLSGNKIQGEAAVRLCGALRLLTGLQRLDLSHNALGDVASEALAKLIQESRLTSIDLRSTNLGPLGSEVVLGAIARSSVTNAAVDVLSWGYGERP